MTKPQGYCEQQTFKIQRIKFIIFFATCYIVQSKHYRVENCINRPILIKRSQISTTHISEHVLSCNGRIPVTRAPKIEFCLRKDTNPKNKNKLYFQPSFHLRRISSRFL